MDPFADQSMLYRKLDEEMTLFISAFAALLRSPSVKRDVRGQAERHMARGLGYAQKIGGKLLQDMETLDRDFRFFLSRPFERNGSEKVMQDALRIKHEVSEL